MGGKPWGADWRQFHPTCEELQPFLSSDAKAIVTGVTPHGQWRALEQHFRMCSRFRSLFVPSLIQHFREHRCLRPCIVQSVVRLGRIRLKFGRELA